MGQTVEIVSLGGCGGFGQNATLLVADGEGLLVDFGIGFPRGLPVGAARVVPDAEPLAGQVRLAGVVLTHGHDDHAGALAWLPEAWRGAPVTGSPYTLAVARARCRQVDSRALRTVEEPAAGGTLEWGPFRVQLIPVTHSAPESRAVVIDTPGGRILHTGDFKFDRRPFRGAPADPSVFAELGRRGIDLLLSDSTGARRPGRTRCEGEVYPALARAVAGAAGQVTVTTFASHLHRIEAVCRVARESGRRVGLLGRRMNETVRLAADLGLWQAEPGLILPLPELSRLPPAERLLLAGGCQGEPGSSLARVSFGQYAGVTVGPGDLVVFSSSTIPGSEVQVGQMVDRLLRLGAEVIGAEDVPALHASGHASRDELEELLDLVRPRFFVPTHGDRVHLERAASLARGRPQPPEQVEIIERGDRLRLGPEAIEVTGHVELLPRVLDNAGMELGGVQIRERRRLARAGVVVVRVRRSRESGASPEVRTEALGIPEWEGDGGRACAVEAAVHGLLAGRGGTPPEIEEIVARKVGSLLRGANRQRPQVVVLIDPGPGSPGESDR